MHALCMQAYIFVCMFLLYVCMHAAACMKVCMRVCVCMCVRKIESTLSYTNLDLSQIIHLLLRLELTFHTLDGSHLAIFDTLRLQHL